MNKYIIGIDLGGTNTKIALIDAKFSIKAKITFSTLDFLSSRDKLISEIIQKIFLLIKENNLTNSKIIGVGIGVPGPVDFLNGKVYYLPNIPRWKNTFIKDILEKKINLRVFVDNDVNLMALAEARLGAAKGAKNAVCLTLGTGVGGGLIIEGKLFRGSNFCAGEIGHMPINITGPKCSCGGSGCLERYVGNKFVLTKARKEFKNKNMTLEQLSELSRNGNKTALSIYYGFAEEIGIALTGVVNLLNPEVIVIGGGLSFAGNFIFIRIKETIDNRAMPIQSKAVRIKKAVLGKDSGLIGAALLAKENLFRKQKIIK